MVKTIQLSSFPYLVEANKVKVFLENITGQGTVVALEVKKLKKGNRAYARVQFKNSNCTKTILDLAASGHLYYGSTYLKAYEGDADITCNPRTFVHEMEGIRLNFGCQTPENKFYVLWKGANVSVKFGIGLKKMNFHLNYDSTDYRLQLSYENIWQIVLFNAPGQESKFLLIQLFGAPRIYKKLPDSIYSFFMEAQDEQWVRTTDFTQSCIGQSSGLCLQLPVGMRLPNFRDSFAYYKESETPLILEKGIPFSENLPLVPIVKPPRGIELPYGILFKVCSLIQSGCLSGPTLGTNFFQLVNPQRFDKRYIEHALEKLYYLKDCCYDPVKWLGEQYQNY